MSEIRNDLGLCPQENMVFPDLNVFEQIEFFGQVRIMTISFCKIKAISCKTSIVLDAIFISLQLKATTKTRKQIKEDVNILLSKLKLSEKRNFLPSKLSGGQQRRLCLGMALIGDASVSCDTVTMYIATYEFFKLNLLLDYNFG